MKDTEPLESDKRRGGRPNGSGKGGERGPGIRGKLLKAAALVLAASIPAAAGISWAAVAGTKHNFGKFSPGEVKTTATTEICVFCHTPHNSSPSKPIWNRQDSGATYSIYESLTMVAAPGQPTGSSKLCLSCHDGTIAVGSLLNLPGKDQAGTLPVTGPGVTVEGKISPTSVAYIGTDLRDDHPISFDYSQSYPFNTEIKPDTSFPPGVKLDANAKLQCTSCHDPHGTAFSKFMVSSLENGALCASCHDKRYWETMPAVHRDSTAVWNGNGQNPWSEDMGAAGWGDETVQRQSCLSCHKSHGGAAGKELLRGTNPLTQTVDDEEWTCLNCHSGNVASKDMGPLFNYLSKHDVKGTYGLHSPSRQVSGDPARESAANLGTNRHAECADCHNSHALKSGNHAVGDVNGNVIGANLLGGWGVKPTPWGPAGSPAVTYTVVDFTTLIPGSDNLEGYMCIKCHSYYAYGTIPPDVPSGAPDGSIVKESDATEVFNVDNMSFHPVFAQGRNLPPSTANPNWPANGLGLTNTFRYIDFPGIGQRTGFYNVTHLSTVTCSDCHASSEPADPKGTHGSNEKWILTRNQTGVGTFKNFCYNCHRRDVYGDEGYVDMLKANYARVTHPVDGLGLASPFYTPGANTGNASNKFGILCLSCHGGSYDAANNVIKGVHGSNAAAGPAPGSDPLGYRMMNGACVESYTRATTLNGADMQFRVVTPLTDKVCNNNFSNFIGNTANYDCNNIATCSF